MMSARLTYSDAECVVSPVVGGQCRHGVVEQREHERDQTVDTHPCSGDHCTSLLEPDVVDYPAR